MTLLTIAQRVADQVGLPRPTSVASATDQLGRQLFALANEILDDLKVMDWPILHSTHTFNTANAVSQYALPDDFARIVTDTVYDANSYYHMRGSLSAAEWRQRVNGLNNSTGRFKFRIFGNPLKINLTPVPSAVETVVFEYISSKPVVSGTNVPQTEFSSDGDTTVLPDRLLRLGLRWKLKAAKGLEYAEDYDAYLIAKKQDFAQALMLPTIPVGRATYATIPELGDGYVPETGFGA